MDPILTTVMQLAALADAIAGSLDGAKLCVFDVDISPTKNTTVSDLSIVTQTGMEARVIVWDAPWIDTDGQVVLSCPSSLFQATGTLASPFIVYGWAITDGAGTELFAAVRLVTPVSILVVGNGLMVEPLITPFAAL